MHYQQVRRLFTPDFPSCWPREGHSSKKNSPFAKTMGATPDHSNDLAGTPCGPIFESIVI